MADTMEVLKLKQQNVLLQAQTLERDILVREHSRLMGEAQELQQQIMKIEEEVRQNEINQSNPVYPEPLANVTGLNPTDRGVVV